MQDRLRIAILSFHNAANYGAALQAVALQRKLDELGYYNDYIDYQNKYRRHAYDMLYQFLHAFKTGRFINALKYAVGAPFMFLRKHRFANFYKEYLRKTDDIYSNSIEASKLNSKYDKFIVGSDQVWNPENNGGDMAFLLNFVDDWKKISYSSSFGLSSIPSQYESQYRELLSKFKNLAVRESDGVRLVKELTGRNATLVLDPVFLIDKNSWMELANKFEDDFIFSYTNKKGQLEKFFSITNYNIKNQKIYKLTRQTSPMDFLSPKIKVKYTMSPQDFIGVVNSAKLVVSASFHCISLAIILNRPFIAILTGDKGKDERLQSLLNLLNLNDRILTTNMTSIQVSSPIDYSVVNQKLKELKNSSIQYLISAIES